MFFTVAGVPAGYGYLTTTAVAGENIVPAMIAHFKSADPDTKLGAPIAVGHIIIQVSADAQVSINNRAPILVKAGDGVAFDSISIYSIVFETAVSYNIIASY